MQTYTYTLKLKTNTKMKKRIKQKTTKGSCCLFRNIKRIIK